MKNQKGITLVSLVIYIVLLFIILSILTIITNHFSSNVKYLSNTNKNISQINKFNMYFVNDVKKNNDIKTIENNKLIFKDGTSYTYIENTIYRNNLAICNNIREVSFSKKEETNEKNFTKKIINVKLMVKGLENFIRENEYVLKYW